MNTRLIVRVTAPVVAISLLLLAVGIGAAFYVQHWNTTVSEELRVSGHGIRAGEELEILVREARTRLDHFLITGDRSYLTEVPKLRSDTDRWLAEAEFWSVRPDQRQLILRVRQGEQRFWSELERITSRTPPGELPGQIRSLAEVLWEEILKPAHEYLDLNELALEKANETNQSFANQLVYGLLLLGTCGSAAGLLAGFGVARGLSRSLIQLSVLIRDTAGRLEESVEPITYTRGDLGELESVLRLIADRVKAIVERLQQREREILQAEQLAAVGQLAAGMAHELRNPLTSMKILVQAAQDTVSEEGVGDNWDSPGLSSRDLRVLEEEITRLERLIQSFLDFARPPEPEKRLLDVRLLVEQTLALLAGRARTVHVRMEFLPPPQPVLAIIDPGQFRQVILNLVLNALGAMASGGVITVGLEAAGDGWLTLRVADSGCGLPAALGERIFDPFTTTKETGLGLGLSICKRIATAHAGTITGANRPQGGAVFTVRLPAR